MIAHLDSCSQAQPPSVWQGTRELMQTCPECQRCGPADPGTEAPAWAPPHRGAGLPIPPAPKPRRAAGWPTHRARARQAKGKSHTR